MHTCRYIIGKIHTLLVTAGKVASPKADSQAFAKLKPKIAKALAAIKIDYCSIPVKNASSFRYTRQLGIICIVTFGIIRKILNIPW